jgi:MFS family permease
MAVSFDWQTVWWTTAGFSVLSFLLFAILFRMPKQEATDAEQEPAPVEEEEEPSLTKDRALIDEEQGKSKNGIVPVICCAIGGLIIGILLFDYIIGKHSLILNGVAGALIGIILRYLSVSMGVNRNFWMIGIAFGLYNLVAMAMVTFYPQFLEIVRGYSLTYDNGVLMHASFVTALILGVAIFTGPGGGYISDRLGKRKIMILIPYILMTLTFLFPFKVTGSLILLYVIVLGIVNGPLAAVLLAAVPEVAKKPQYIGSGMAAAIFCQNIGMYISGELFPKIQAAAGWEAAGYWMIPICVIGIIATLCIKVR